LKVVGSIVFVLATIGVIPASFGWPPDEHAERPAAVPNQPSVIWFPAAPDLVLGAIPYVDEWIAELRAAEEARLAAERAAAEAEAARLVEEQRLETERAAARRAAASAVLPPPPTPVAYAGGANAHLYRIKMCESGGNYQAVSPNGMYRGAYQFAWATWAAMGGSGDPAQASPAEQDMRAQRLYDSSNPYTQWPVCAYR
jgi:hypothetical protein